MACSLTSGREVRDAGENIQSTVAIVSHIKLQNVPCLKLYHNRQLEACFTGYSKPQVL